MLQREGNSWNRIWLSSIAEDKRTSSQPDPHKAWAYRRSSKDLPSLYEPNSSSIFPDKVNIEYHQPEKVPQCSTVNLTWQGGQPPFTLFGEQRSKDGRKDSVKWTIASNLQGRYFNWTGEYLPLCCGLYGYAYSAEGSLTAAVSDDADIEIRCEDSTVSDEKNPSAHVAAPHVHFKIARSSADNGRACLDSFSTTTFKTGLYLQRRQETSEAFGSYGPPWLGKISSLATNPHQQGMVVGMSVAIAVLFLGFVIILWLYVRLRTKVKATRSVQKTLVAWREGGPCVVGGSVADHTEGGLPRTRELPHRSMYSRLFGHAVSKPSGDASFNAENYLHIFKQLSEGSNFSNPTTASPPHPEGAPPTLLPEVARISSIPVLHTPQRQAEEESEVVVPPPPVHDPNLQRKILAWESTFVPARHLSVAPSEPASTVGGFSAISDEHYHRSKASTMSPGGSISPTPSKNQAKRNLLGSSETAVAAGSAQR